MNRLRQYREKAGFSQAQLSQITGIQQYKISKIENEHEAAWPAYRRKFAIALQTTEEELFPDEVARDRAKAEKQADLESRVQRLRQEVMRSDRS